MTPDSLSTAPRAALPLTEVAGCSGLELVVGLLDGSIPGPPMADSLPFRLIHAGEGEAGLLATPEARFFNLTQTVHGGWAMTMLDTAMSLAAQTTLAPGEICPTHETSAKFLRPITLASGVLHIIGRVLTRGRSVITLEGRVEDTQGKLFAHGTSTCLIVRRAGRAPERTGE